MVANNQLAFSRVHPIVSLLFYAVIIVLTFIISNPIFISISFIAALSYCLIANLKATIKIFITMVLPLGMFIVVLNPIFNHEGNVFFYLFDIAITYEAIFSGFIAAFRLMAAFLWFYSYNYVMSNDKFIYLFGKTFPNIALIITMTISTIPRFIREYRKMVAAQKMIGQYSDKTFFDKIRTGCKIFVSLVNSSLDSGVTTANCILARGYASGKRTSITKYKFNSLDGVLLFIILVYSGCVSYSIAISGFSIYNFISVLTLSLCNYVDILGYCAFALLTLSPIFYEIYWGIKWKYLVSKI